MQELINLNQQMSNIIAVCERECTKTNYLRLDLFVATNQHDSNMVGMRRMNARWKHRKATNIKRCTSISKPSVQTEWIVLLV